ncbi:hypothetical protein CMV_018288 [Castanea mollissima]|uniref:KIB1-4 beta-propeller domain-containing protein n=1 Tax=Castanea mollissima TaxID=60419 RepID=A0A8J4R4S9_9ROSI|nr:hypothetical protein CMV_018288 [Castanea mollissima]
MAPDWSSIPVDLLRLVANKVHSLEDYVHFGAVCWSWNHATTTPKNNNLKSLFPWLLLADRENNDSRGFYSSSSNKVYEFHLPEIGGKRCWGSPFGWLVVAGIDNMEIQLFNPLSRASISLPSQTIFMGDENENSIMHYWYVNKVVISSNPPNCIVMAIYSCYRKLAFAKPGDHVWSEIRLDNTVGTGFSDITYFNGDFFIAKCTGQLLVCDFSGIDPVAIEFAPSPPGVADEARYLLYLVDLGGLGSEWIHWEIGPCLWEITTLSLFGILAVLIAGLVAYTSLMTIANVLTKLVAMILESTITREVRYKPYPYRRISILFFVHRFGSHHNFFKPINFATLRVQ